MKKTAHIIAILLLVMASPAWADMTLNIKVLLRLSAGPFPRLIKKVNPVYPEEALKKKIAGTVIMEATIDEKGKVKNGRIIKSPDPLLSNAVMGAVKQWVYEPFIVNGKAKSVIFTVNVTFTLQDEPKAKNANNALTRLHGAQRPQVIKHVDPVYPAAAQEKKIAGSVVLEVVIDEKGMVLKSRIIKSPSLLLNEAALTAVRQWVYEPYDENGKAKSVVFMVTVTFTLQNE